LSQKELSTCTKLLLVLIKFLIFSKIFKLSKIQPFTITVIDGILDRV